ncbi:MAG: hypothetical protein LBB88_11805 [Planctomycetaceae bacterium]|jgi:hypothetical protein|nr:hypothetical protein [Planctomycetaceae bacterium]
MPCVSCWFDLNSIKVGDLSPKGRVAEGNDKMESTIIKIISDLPNFRRNAGVPPA